MQPRRFYSRAKAIEALQRLQRRGAVKYKALESRLRRAVLFYWGSMTAARKAAGIRGLPAPRQRWSRERVLHEIAELHRLGQHMSSLAVMKAGRGELVQAAGQYVGSWTRARELAGVAFRRKRSISTSAWEASTVIAEIFNRLEQGLPLAVTKTPSSLTSAAIRIFGSWRDAIAAAGLDYGEIALARTYQDAELLTWIRQLARDNPKMTLFEVDKHGEHAVACRRRWGSLEAAALAAGLIDWPVRTRSRAMAKSEVLRALRDRIKNKQALTFAAVRMTENGYFVINSALHHFKTWTAAIAAAKRRRVAGQRIDTSQEE
jgi:hypothetical protein